MNEYLCTTDWSSHNIPSREKFLTPLAGRPHPRFLEIGSWEGRSTAWLLTHILTGPNARIDCIDIFLLPPDENNYVHDIESSFDHNIKTAGGRNKVTKIKGRSQQILKKFRPNQYDVIYIDGSHMTSE